MGDACMTALVAEAEAEMQNRAKAAIKIQSCVRGSSGRKLARLARAKVAHHLKTFDSEVLCFGTSNFLKSYNTMKTQADAIKQPDQIWKIINAFGAALGFQEDEWQQFVGSVRLQVDEYIHDKELVPTPEMVLILAWSSDKSFQRLQLCSHWNQILRDDQQGIDIAALAHRVLNRHLVTRGSFPMRWPVANKCFRGTAIPVDMFDSFFFKGLIYRIPFIVAFSFSQEVAMAFAVNSAADSNGAKMPVVFEEEFDTSVAFPYCKHVNYVEHSVLTDQHNEKEFLHGAYSIFEVLKIQRDELSGMDARTVRVLAHSDNKEMGLRGVPLARWH